MRGPGLSSAPDELAKLALPSERFKPSFPPKRASGITSSPNLTTSCGRDGRYYRYIPSRPQYESGGGAWRECPPT